MSGKLKVGIVGAGAIGSVHANALVSIPDVELAMVCDVDKAKVAAMADKHGVKARFDDYREAVKADLDAVYVCVGNTLHRDVAVAALKAGKHVLLEKPMAMNSVQAKEIADAATASGKVLQMGMMWRQEPTARIVREYVEKGEFGEIYHIIAVMRRRRGIPGLGGWFTTKGQSGGGPLIDLGVHWFDISMWMSGLWNPVRVSAKTYAKFGKKMKDYKYVSMWAGPPKFDGVCDVEDYSTGMIRFGGGATMSFEISWAGNSQGESYVEILGEKAGVRVFDGKPVQFLAEYGGRPADIAPQFDGKGDNMRNESLVFVNACRGKCKPAATAEEGLTVMKLIDAVYASSEQDREVELK